MSTPLVIGVAAAYERARWSFWDMPAAIVASTYLDHLAHGNATPVAFVPSEATVSNAEQLIGMVDGLLLLGGADVDPAMYGEERAQLLEATVPIRDRSEIALVRAALAQSVPILGVCRGLHIMNVATGGSLHQDIGELGELRHRKAPGRLDAPTVHGVEIAQGSAIARALGAGDKLVNSHHHQAVKRLGRGGSVTATSPDDGVVEAVEWEGNDFAVGVQWHPEAADLGGVFRVFLEACGNRADRSETEGRMANTHNREIMNGDL